MATRDEVERFLREFHTKCGIFGIKYLSRTNPKNNDTLTRLEISPSERQQVIENLSVFNYVEGPMDDKLYQIADMWVFGLRFKNLEIYIKVSLGGLNSAVYCISFHVAQYPIIYPFH